MQCLRKDLIRGVEEEPDTNTGDKGETNLLEVRGGILECYQETCYTTSVAAFRTCISELTETYRRD
jgi:hypothetical protein